jgi:hypothetical protein
VNKNSIPNIWTAQEKVTHLYKLLALGLGAFAFLMVVVSIVEAFRNPIVVVRAGDVQEFYPTERKRASLEKSDIEVFTKQFLASLYVWKEFNALSTARDIAPFAEAGLVAKVTDGQSQKYAKELKGKRLAQAITFVNVEVLDTQVVARFDRVLKIEGIPLIIPTEVTLSMVQGDPTRLNPMGIYVSGITETDGAK